MKSSWKRMIRCALTRCPALFYVMITKSSGKPCEVAGAIVEITVTDY